jgi:hypothetical protein
MMPKIVFGLVTKILGALMNTYSLSGKRFVQASNPKGKKVYNRK